MKNIKHIWTVLCSNSSIDQSTNNVSLFNVIEQITLGLKPNVKINYEEEKGIPINMELVTLWQRLGDLTSFEQSVEIVDPKGKVLAQNQISFEFPNKVSRSRVGFKLIGLKVTGAGEYVFRVSVKEKGKARFEQVQETPLDIRMEK